jgi:hypothetical protein
MQKTYKILLCIFVLLSGLTICSAGIEVNKKVNDLFEVNWESIRYNKSVSRYNLKVSTNEQDSRVSENLSLSCQVEIKDPNIVLGTCQQGVITEMTDSKGQNVDPGQNPPQLRHMSYDGLRYRERYTQPPQMPKWKAIIRSLLRVRPTTFQPELINELQPSRLNLQINIELLEPSGGEIKDLKGYFYALTAESLEYVDVPFEPNNTWVQLTDDLTIQVREAQCTASASRVGYNYDIEESWTSGRRLNRLTLEDNLPAKIVVDRQIIGEDGKSIHRFRGFGSLPAHVGGGGSGSHSSSSGVSPIEKFRFVIAVKPSHNQIPFELKKIPLPNPELKEERKLNR